MTQKDEVVDGDNAFDTTLTESDGQFARETVVDLYTVTPEVLDDTVGAPEGRPSLTPPVEGENTGEKWGGGIAESGTLDDLVTQVVPALVGGIEEVLHIRVMTTQQVVDKGTPIAA